MPEVIEDSELDELTFSKDAKPVENKSRYYVDDEDLTRILSAWKLEYDRCKAEGLPSPRLPEAVGEAILDMAEQMGRRHNFSGYSYIDEMKSVATIHCVKYIHNFNPNVDTAGFRKKKVSAFAYINMIIWRSFTNYIGVEKREQYLKYKSFELMGGMDAFQDEDMAEASGGEGESSGMSIGALGADFIQKAREYEEQHGLDGKGGRKVKKDKFDDFMFTLGQKSEAAPEGVDLELGADLEIEFEA